MTKRNLKLIVLLPISGIFMLLIIFYWQRNNILEPFFRKKIERYEQNNSIRISYNKVCLSGLSNLQISDLYVIPENNDTLVCVKELEAKLNLWRLFFRKIEFKDLKINGFYLSLKDDNGKRNFDFLFRKNNQTEEEKAGIKLNTSGYAQKMSNLLSLFFRFIPENILISQMSISAQSAGFYSTFDIPEFKIKDHRFFSQVTVNESGQKQYFVIEGDFFNDDKKLNCKIYALKREFVKIPYLPYKYNAHIAFDTLEFQFFPLKDEKDLLQLGGALSFHSLNIWNERLSMDEVSFTNSMVEYVVNLHPDYFELDSATTIRFNKLAFNPYIRMKTKPEIDFTASIRKNNFPADDLFSSLPKGLFHNLEGIKTSGTLSYNFYFTVNMANVDSLEFQSSLSRENFRIERFGKTDFTEVQEPFLHSAYENGKLAKSFVVGDSCPNFRKIEDISPYLKSAVLFAEDGFFYSHTGFVDDALRSSLVKNITEKRFARGGSTISMQLVKNLYLSRDKTITRKLEEALIVWLIEHNRLLSKNRMLEIYFNIIEWGPGIYGAGEGARFYFNKEAADLTPEEAIFMASIVARPKKFMWFFDENRELKPFLAQFYEVVGMRMLKHGYITEKQFEELTPNVRVTGEALSLIR